MATTNFVDQSTIITAEWLNEADAIVHDVFGAATTDSAARTSLGVSIGTDVQGYDPDIPTEVVTQAEAEAGTSTANRTFTPERVKQAIVALAASGSGDVVGPAGATDNAVARFDLTTGKLIQDSVVLVSDTGDFTGVGTFDGRNVAVDGTKLDGVEALADVTDATNVAAAGASMLSANNTLTGTNQFNKTIYLKKGADIASANDLVLLADGNSNDITGTTTINGMTDGISNELRHFKVDSALTLKHNTAASTGYSSLYIVQSAADVTLDAGAEFDAIYDGTLWRIVNINLASGAAVVGGAPSYAKLSDVKAAGTDGGTFTSGAWETRTLNTEDTDDNAIVSIASNQFTLQAGTYEIFARAPVVGAVDGHACKIRNISDSTDTLIGSVGKIPAADIGGYSFVSGQFTITATKTFELQHRCVTTRSTDGFGAAANIGVSEIYSQVEIRKVA